MLAGDYKSVPRSVGSSGPVHAPEYIEFAVHRKSKSSWASWTSFSLRNVEQNDGNAVPLACEPNQPLKQNDEHLHTTESFTNS